MSKATKGLAVLTATMLAAGIGCSDTTTSPTAPMRADNAESRNLLGGLLGGVIGTVTDLLIPPVTRNTPLATDVVWTFTAGPGGGYTRNSSVGLTVVIPPGALATTQQITVTALAGRPVAYKFEPHLEFDRKVTLTQSLVGTSAGGLLSLPLLSGAHFDTDRLTLTDDGLAVVTETVPALGNILTKTATFNVGHFSGWILASGRSEQE